MPATRLQSPATQTPGSYAYTRGHSVFFTWLDPGQSLALSVTAGLVYGNVGNATVALYKVNAADPASISGAPAAQASILPDRAAHAVTLASASAGLHAIVVEDQMGGTQLVASANQPLTKLTSSSDPSDYVYRYTEYFYVPKGTTVVGGYAAAGPGQLRDAADTLLATFDNQPAGYFSVAVAPGQDGKFWRFYSNAGARQLLTVPPQLARSSAELLVPAEVVAAETSGCTTSTCFPISSTSGAAADIAVSASATPETLTAPNTLKDMLGRITGNTFSVTTTPTRAAINLGLAGDFAACPTSFSSGNLGDTEQYALVSSASSLCVTGAAAAGLTDAVWGLLARLGYRHYFPGPTWEIVPSSPSLGLDVNATERPAFASRRFFFSWGTWGDNDAAYSTWAEHNRMHSDLNVATSHNYQSIIAAKPDVFTAEHPEYLSTNRLMFCVTKQAVVAAVVDYALGYFAAHPDSQSISMEPSDTPDWSGCTDDDVAFPNYSDRVVTLANAVAAAIQVPGKERWVGIQAYSSHTQPPTISVNDHVIVNTAAQPPSGGGDIVSVLSGWRNHGAKVGIREYYNSEPQAGGLPARERISNWDYVATSIPSFFHDGSARYMMAETGDTWGSGGFGHWLAAKLLWGTDGSDARALAATARQELLDRAFNEAAPQMKPFFDLLDGHRAGPFSQDQVGRLYRALDAALSAELGGTNDAAVIARIGDLTKYMRHVELFRAYQLAKVANQDPGNVARDTMLKFAYRIHATGMVHSLGLYRSLVAGGTPANFPNDWRDTTAFTLQDLQTLIANGVSNNPLRTFEPTSYSQDLIPATALVTTQLAAAPRGSYTYTRSSELYTSHPSASYFYTWLSNSAPTTLQLSIATNTVYGFRGDTSVRLQRLSSANLFDMPSSQSAEQLVYLPAHGATDPPYQQTFTSSGAGLHAVIVNDGQQGTKLTWPTGTPTVRYLGPDALDVLDYRYTLYFYVPAGTSSLGFYAECVDGTFRVHDPATNTWPVRFTCNTGEKNYFELPLAASDTGRFWKMDNSSGFRQLLTVPPYAALSPSELMLPREVVEADAP